MSWVIVCPNHGRLIEEYHVDALHQLDIHSNEQDKSKFGKTFLYELESTRKEKGSYPIR